MPFIILSGQDQVDAKTRRVIRRQMIGKNRGKTTSMKRGETNLEAETDPDGLNKSPESLIKISRFFIPMKIGSDLSFTQFADTIEPSMAASMLKFSSIAKKALFPLEGDIKFYNKQEEWFEPLKFDAAYLHAMAFGAQSFFSWVLGDQAFSSSQVAFLHFMKALQLLRERLEFGDEIEKVSNTTIYVVLTLATHAHMVGEHESAKDHMIGFRKMVSIRGGITTFRSNMKLLIEILRCDIRMALNDGRRPLFFNNPFWEPFIPFSELATPESGMDEFLHKIDGELARAWRAMKKFCSLIIAASHTKHKLSQKSLFNTMASVLYRLLYMSFETNSLNEVLRFRLLAFASNVFLQWQALKLAHLHFHPIHRDCLLKHKSSCDLSSDFLIWLLIVGRLSIFSEVDDVWIVPWLRLNIGSSQAGEWNETRQILESFMWIRVIQDEPGKTIFESVFL
ncbi:hypothetical protein F5884DRAFT_749398 [Xylogone sp. PMI_703]|nr:hypothetical protein F5884DRAFT_749398 [Xylogone sp. PMI_703]